MLTFMRRMANRLSSLTYAGKFRRSKKNAAAKTYDDPNFNYDGSQTY